MIKLPKHINCIIEHNGHNANYETLETYCEYRQLSDAEWATPTSRERAMQADEIWELQWYPETPTGFRVIAGATLDEVIARANAEV